MVKTLPHSCFVRRPDRMSKEPADTHEEHDVDEDANVGAEESSASWMMPLMLVMLAVMFLPTLAYGFVTWDDPIIIWFNPLVQQWSQSPLAERLLTPNLGYPMPLPVAIYAATFSMFPNSPAFLLHAVSTTLHIGNALLLLALGTRLLGARKPAIFAAGIWALHPIVVEGVAWCSNLKELLYTSALFAALLFWDRFLESEARSRRLGGAVLAALLLGFASKPTMLVAPVAMLVLGVVRHKEVMRQKGALVIQILGLVWSAGWWWLSTRMHNEGLLGESAANFATRDYGVTVLKSVGLQVWHWINPTTLQPYYPEQLVAFDAFAILGGLASLGWIAGVVWAWRKSHWSLTPLLLLGVCWAPYSNLSPLPRFTADTYMYAASALVAVILAGSVWRLASSRLPERFMGVIVLISWILLLGPGLTQVSRWSSTQELFGPLLGQPEQFALPYQLVAYERYALEKDLEGSTKLLIEAWPHLIAQTGPPGFAPQAFLEAGLPEWAARATLQGIRSLEPRASAEALTTMAKRDLPVPSDVAPLAREALARTKKANLATPEVIAWANRRGL